MREREREREIDKIDTIVVVYLIRICQGIKPFLS
jgi:hypothetical protein